MKYLYLKALIFILLLSTGCAYYNTFFNAKKFFAEAEKERIKRLDKEKKKTDPSNKKNIDQPSSSELKKYDEAIKKASKVLEIYPKSKYVDDALFLLGECFYRKQEYAKAQRKFLELIGNFPNSKFVSESQLWLGKTHIQLEDYETAEKNLHDILNSKAKDEIRDEARFLLGGLFKHKGDFVTAIDEYENAARHASDKIVRANAYYEMGDCYYQLKNFAKAVESFKQARKYSPDSKFEFNAMLRAGLALKDLEKYDDAIKIFTNLLGDIVNEENWPLCRLEIAHCNRLKGEFDNAIQWYMDIITQHPKTEEAATAYYYLGIIYQDVSGNYEQAKEYYDKSALEYPNAQIVPESRIKSKNIQQLLTLRANIEAQRKRIAQGDSIAAILTDMNLNGDELPKFDLTELDTLVATSLQIPLDSIMAYQDTLLKLYDGYYEKYFDQFGEKIPTIDEIDRRNKPKIELTLLDSLVAQTLQISLTYLEDFADSLYHIYDRHYANYKRNKVIYDQFFQTKNQSGKNKQLGTPLEEMVKSKLELAELYLIEFSLPDSALKEFIDVLEIDTSKKAIPKALFSIGYICENFKKDTLLADSVYQRLVADYPDDPFAQQARKKIKTIKVVDPEAIVAKKFQMAEKEYIDNHKYDAAISTLEEIYKESPTSEYAPKALLAMGWIYEHSINQYDKAFDVYQNLVNDYPTSIYAKKVKSKIDAVVQARSASTEKTDEDKDETRLAEERGKSTTDTTQVAAISVDNKEQYRWILRREMEKNDPRRKTPRRW